MQKFMEVFQKVAAPTELIKYALGGFYIGLAALLFIKAGGGLLGAALFPIGILLVAYGGGALVTGKTYKQAKLPEYILTLIIAFAFNLAGIFLLAFLVQGSFDASKIVAVKSAISACNLLIFGALCNVLVCLSLELGKKHIVLYALPIFTFVALGFEHVVADMMYYALDVVRGGSMCEMLRVIGLVGLGNLLGGLVCMMVIAQMKPKKGRL